MEKGSLYLVKTMAFRGYVVAKDLNEAWEKFKNYLENLGVGGNKYGTYDERQLDSISIIATTEAHKPKSSMGTNYDDKDSYDVLVVM